MLSLRLRRMLGLRASASLSVKAEAPYRSRPAVSSLGQRFRSKAKGRTVSCSAHTPPKSPLATSALKGEGKPKAPDGTVERVDTKADERRTLSVTFTCDRCGGRTTRLVNPHAYAKGTVFVQCAVCDVWHKLVDNVDLIEEYNFADSDKAQESP